MNFEKLLSPIDVYCERTSALYWAEPVNALTNLVFILVGCYFLLVIKKQELKSKSLKFLSVNTIVVGVGSFLFHTHANFWSMWFDILPILVLICAIFYIVGRHMLNFSKMVSVFLVIGFFVVGYALQVLVPPYFNGSIVYSHAVFGLLVVSYLLGKHSPKVGKYYLASTGAFFISLTFRTFDHEICDLFPLGTHFLWHTFNGATLWFAIQGVYVFQFEKGSKVK